MIGIFAFVIPLLFLVTFLLAILKKIPLYDTFAEGVKGAIPLVLSIFPYIATVMMLSKLFTYSGLEAKIISWISPVLEWAGIPEEIAELVLLKPLSGSGSTAELARIVETYGADSYIARTACVLHGTTDTVFYIGAVYFAGTKERKMTKALLISLIVYFVSVITACFLCRMM